jgi:hypothetical protein
MISVKSVPMAPLRDGAMARRRAQGLARPQSQSTKNVLFSPLIFQNDPWENRATKITISSNASSDSVFSIDKLGEFAASVYFGVKDLVAKIGTSVGLVIEDRNDSTGANTLNLSCSQIYLFMETIVLLSQVQQLDEAVYLILSTGNEYLSDGDFEACNEIVEQVLLNVKRIEPTLLVSFLVMTLAAKNKIPARVRLFAKAESMFLERFGADRTRKLVVGLK